jgi:hypothetical protein
VHPKEFGSLLATPIGGFVRNLKTAQAKKKKIGLGVKLASRDVTKISPLIIFIILHWAVKNLNASLYLKRQIKKKLIIL